MQAAQHGKEEPRAYSGLIACHECDALHRTESLPENSSAHCGRCDARLYRHIPAALERSLALHLTALLLFIIANTFPFMSLKIGGRVETDILLSGPMALIELGMSDIGLLVLLTSIVFPLLVLLGSLYLLGCLRLGIEAPGLGSVFRMVQHLRPWSLIGVFMLAVLIAIVKLLDMAQVEAGTSLFAFAALLPVMTLAQQGFDRSLFWPQEAVGSESAWLPTGAAQQYGLAHCHTCALLVQVSQGHCPRCGDHLHLRKPESLTRTWALLASATLLFFPANMLPIMTVTRFGQGEPSTILSGVEHLIAAGMWPLGLIVFFASIVVPISKLVALIFLLLSIQQRSTWRPEDRTRLYRVTEVIGSWSMVDIFIIALLTSLVSFDALATIRPGIAASFFAGMVVLTMIAARSFDSRLIWDAMEQNAAEVGSMEQEHG
ncbi:MAG: paraquat-inducible membrane protein A [Zetaproteobacteria bacterium CG12_big_fil_rev_8_21_14_0_65_55_1124]|nr:MAG: hypothetical protein AUJ58_08795 [Zetaproteobacteria bacterium CG1_02_55_237]PIS20488.1 MAG: paraquat-inducible membrane protein A [Zetaproteobacteria bacterium CG08_land_8_20_14_0_20_55_17]PIW43815.1 MAG: paraquat-inducible membrane protein A [Zetaproteobacteria bacterium CG12_big_fil_rev_8_21_14_0_65_55_1124]PIY53352.1 MAG: paraquat-inducible membrane protein A [Zetaproteobacteria bacterium CG_4_10_14_0_8_um_filter_55_43]PIZ40170.1 MAG: paraquat-inducible membrane protein A [Zetaprote